MRHLLALGILVAAATAAPAAAAPLAAEIPQWRAVLLEGPTDAHHPDPVARIRISHRGRVLVDRSFPPDTAGLRPTAIRFADAGEAGHVLVWADITSSGRDTLTVTVLYDFAPGASKPRVTTHSWGIFGYERRKTESETVFVTSDSTYYALFDARVFSVVPILVRAYRSGTFVEVTSAHPRLVAAEAAKYRSGFQPDVCESEEMAGAYLADMVRSGETERGLADVTRILPPADDARFFEIMNRVLHAHKLIPDTQRLGAVDGIARCDPKKKRSGKLTRRAGQSAGRFIAAG
ncbi:MAG: hypothetical protein NVS4B13_09550 [Candidatus Elarobacter sp.]